MYKRKKLLILGGGLSGLSLAYFLNNRSKPLKLFEKEYEFGGLCRSVKKKGFRFDFSGHFLHFRNKHTFNFVRNLLGFNIKGHRRKAWVYAFNRFIPYPFQGNLSYLPKEIRSECQDEFIKAKKKFSKNFEAVSLLDWINKKFGRGIGRHFLIPYNLKFWKTSLKQLSSNWADRFIVIPRLKHMKNESLRKKAEDLGYHSYLWYPKKGGIGELTKALFLNVEKAYKDYKAIEIDLECKTVSFQNGAKEKFDTLFSTIPLPELGKIIKNLPKKISKCFNQLKWLSIYNVNLGLKTDLSRKWHWVYFPDNDIEFCRLGFFSNISSSSAPYGKQAIYLDFSYNKDGDFEPRQILAKLKENLKKTGIFNGGTKIICQHVNDIKYGYPIYDKNYNKVLSNIFSFLNRKNIIPCGRYGGWKYLSMEDVILESKKLAKCY